MAIGDIVQSAAKYGSGVTSVSVGSGDGWSTPTSGNKIVVLTAGGGNVSSLSGFTSRESVDSGVNDCADIYDKTSAGTESTIAVTFDTSEDYAVVVYEIEGAVTYDTSVSNTASGTTSIASGSTGTLTGPNGVALAISLAWEFGTDHSYNNSYTVDHDSTSDSIEYMAAGSKALTGTTATSVTASGWSSTDSAIALGVWYYSASTPKTGSDSGTLAESSTRDIGPQSTDSGTVSESGSVDAQATATDTATLAEASAQQEYQDKGPATDSATLAESAAQASRAWTPPQLRVEAGFGHEWNRYDIKGAIEFGGLANEYVKADHINIFKGNDANIASGNGWGGALKFVDHDDGFGGKASRFDYTQVGDVYPQPAIDTNALITSGEAYTHTVWVDLENVANINWIRAGLIFKNSSGVNVDSVLGTVATLSGDGFYKMSVTIPSASATSVQWLPYVYASLDTAEATAITILHAQLSLGSDESESFVPSMRLEGDAEVNMYLDGYWPFVSAAQHILGVDWGGTDRMMGIWTLASGSDQLLRFARENTSSAEILSSFTLPQIPFREDLKIRITDDISIARRWCYIKSAVGNAIDWNTYDDVTAYTPTPGDATYPFCVGTAAGLSFWWNGSIRDITLHDGIYGPIVARFLADDYIAANPPTGWNEIKYSLVHSDEWEDETGHVWEVVDT